jgi:pimeloyl-ACP methyl ester carboxylesterase
MSLKLCVVTIIPPLALAGAFFSLDVASAADDGPGMTTSSSPSVPVRRAYVEGRFGQIHLRMARPDQESARTPLVCFHMSPNSGRIYETFLGHMGTDRLAVAPDTPGFGDSDPPSKQPSISDYAAAMTDVLDALGLTTVDVMGYHTGSETCVELALQQPDRVRKLILTSAPIFSDEELQDFRDHYAKPELSEDGSHAAKIWKGHLFWAGPGYTMDHVGVQFADALRRPDISWWGHNAAFDFPLGEKLKQVTQPVLVLNPNDDLVEHSRRAEGTMQNGRIHELPDWGHGYLDIYTEDAGALIRGYLDGEPS